MTTLHTAIDVGSILLSLTLAALYFRFGSKAATWAKSHGDLAVQLTQALYRAECLALDLEKLRRAANKVRETYASSKGGPEAQVAFWRAIDELDTALEVLRVDANLSQAYEKLGGLMGGTPGAIVASTTDEPKP